MTEDVSPSPTLWDGTTPQGKKGQGVDEVRVEEKEVWRQQHETNKFPTRNVNGKWIHSGENLYIEAVFSVAESFLVKYICWYPKDLPLIDNHRINIHS